MRQNVRKRAATLGCRLPLFPRGVLTLREGLTPCPDCNPPVAFL